MRTFRIISFFAVLIIVTVTITNNSCSKKKETPATTVPLLSTKTASGVTNSSATVGGVITSNGGATVTERGVCYCTSSNPTVSDNSIRAGSGTGTFDCEITGLTQNTKYYIKAYAMNSVGIGYGDQITFSTLIGSACQGVTSVPYQGQTYNTVEIGNQCWFKENLNYQTGNSWCYDNDPANCAVYGRLYDWETALGVCPSGWHLPGDEEWKILEGTVDTQYGVGDPVWNSVHFRGFDGGKHLKSTTGWISNGNGDNSSGFTALPGGFRQSSFSHLMFKANFWSSTEHSSMDAWERYLYFTADEVYRNYSYHNKPNGYSVRCLKD